jgi:2-polyprenyl-3-methyl-5-hydroxy-6-metoxy-1,4-benzoquinol methylase
VPPSLPDPYVRIIVDRLLKYCGKGFSLEVGCGTGKCSLALSISGATTVLLDISKEGVMLAKELYERRRGSFAVPWSTWQGPWDARHSRLDRA